MNWLVFLGTELATTYDRGDTAIEAAGLYLAENFPEHAKKAALSKSKGGVAEVRVEDVHIRIERRTVKVAA